MAREPLETDSELYRRLARPKLAVRGRNSSWPLYLGYGALALVALFVFLSLSKQRLTRVQPQTAAVPASPLLPPPIGAAPILPPTPTVAPPMAIIPQPTPTVAVPGQAPAAGLASPEARLRAPVMVVDLARGPGGGEPAATVVAAGTTAATPIVPPTGNSAAATTPAGSAHADDERFAAVTAAHRPETVEAGRLASTSLIAPQGTTIPAVLETAMDSSLPGYARAVVSRDVRGFDGSTVLIPRGTKLIGEYKSGVAIGQTRAFVVWTRLLTPDGISVDIGSPAIDTLGRGGIQGEANTHFLRRFGAAILLSVLNAGLEAGVNHFSQNNSTVLIGTPQQANSVATLALQRDIDIPTTITVPQGTPIRVFIARDLDFSGLVAAAR